MALETELKTYHEKLPELLAHRGQFVVISGVEILGTFADYGDALIAGYKTYGMKPFLVKKIEEVETVQRLTRNVGVCHT